MPNSCENVPFFSFLNEWPLNWSGRGPSTASPRAVALKVDLRLVIASSAAAWPSPRAYQPPQGRHLPCAPICRGEDRAHPRAHDMSALVANPTSTSISISFHSLPSPHMLGHFPP